VTSSWFFLSTLISHLVPTALICTVWEILLVAMLPPAWLSQLLELTSLWTTTRWDTIGVEQLHVHYFIWPIIHHFPLVFRCAGGKFVWVGNINTV